MRFALVAVVASMVISVTAIAQVISSSEKPTTNEKDVLDMLGKPMSQVFAKFGTPADARGVKLKSKSPLVRLDYGKFAFSVHDKQVRECFVWSVLIGVEPLGVKFGEATGDIEKRLGKPKTKVTNAGGGGIINWDAPDNSHEIEVVFSKENKCIGFGVIKSGSP